MMQLRIEWNGPFRLGSEAEDSVRRSPAPALGKKGLYLWAGKHGERRRAYLIGTAHAQSLRMRLSQLDDSFLKGENKLLDLSGGGAWDAGGRNFKELAFDPDPPKSRATRWERFKARRPDWQAVIQANRDYAKVWVAAVDCPRSGCKQLLEAIENDLLHFSTVDCEIDNCNYRGRNKNEGDEAIELSMSFAGDDALRGELGFPERCEIRLAPESIFGMVG